MSLRLSVYGNRLLKSSGLLTSQTAFTWIAFVKINALPPATNYAYILTVTGGGLTSSVYIDDAGYIRGNAENSTADTGRIGASVAVGGAAGANQFAIIWRGTGTGSGAMRVSIAPVNGAGLTTLSMAFGGGSPTPAQMSIGSPFADGAFGSRTFDGYISHSKVWNRSLSDVEVVAELSSGAPVASGAALYNSFTDAMPGALTPSIGSGAWVQQEVAPTISADNPVFVPPGTPAAGGSDTLPVYAGPTWGTATPISGVPGTTVSYRPPLLTGGATATFSKVSGPAWASVDPVTGTVSGVLAAPSLSVIVRATTSLPALSADIAIPVVITGTSVVAATWAGDRVTYAPWVGLSGVGRYGALRVRMTGLPETSWASAQVVTESGGPL